MSDGNEIDEDEDAADFAEEADDVEIVGDSDGEDPEPQRFNVSSYGWDSDVEGLVKRLDRGDIYTPGFQRRFVWTNPEKSRFVESLILGLPVPTIFLAQDADSKRLNIVDGQQRLKTLQEYLGGRFPLRGNDIQEDLRGRYFSVDVAKTKKSKVLTDSDARALADSLIHSVVIRPDASDNDENKGHEYNRAVIQIFKRLNTSGRPLQPQEVRASIFHGPLDEMLRRMNVVESWRQLFGKQHSRLKDLEAILRFLALLNDGQNYKSPMPRFLDNFMEQHRYIEAALAKGLEADFQSVTSLVVKTRGTNAFKNGGTFVLSTFDAVMVGAVTAMRSGVTFDEKSLEKKWAALEADARFIWATEEFVNDTNRVSARLERAIAVFGG